jgi:hypothetical protein
MAIPHLNIFGIVFATGGARSVGFNPRETPIMRRSEDQCSNHEYDESNESEDANRGHDAAFARDPKSGEEFSPRNTQKSQKKNKASRASSGPGFLRRDDDSLNQSEFQRLVTRR